MRVRIMSAACAASLGLLEWSAEAIISSSFMPGDGARGVPCRKNASSAVIDPQDGAPSGTELLCGMASLSYV